MTFFFFYFFFMKKTKTLDSVNLTLNDVIFNEKEERNGTKDTIFVYLRTRRITSVRNISIVLAEILQRDHCCLSFVIRLMKIIS